MSVVVVATFRPNPGSFEDLKAVISEAIVAVHKEPGCEKYALQQANDRLVLIEKWADEAALTTHSGAPALATLVEKATPLCAEDIDIVTLEPVPFGTDAQGTL